jgi:pimeloyl-ACP methyl ester carboxylesterase
VQVATNGIELEVHDEGSGETVLLLHGFPDSASVWREQVPALVDAGYRVIAPDLRGFGASDRPDGVESYRMITLAGDVLGLMDALGVQRARAIVGHDFGASLAWVLAMFAPDRLERLVAMSVGHPSFFREPTLEQREKFWYVLFFQFEDVAEAWLRHDGWRFFREAFGEYPDVERAIESLSRPGALTAALNWYRANLRPDPPGEGIDLPPVKVPTMGLWSSLEPVLIEEQMTASGGHVDGSWRYERVEGAGHWLQLDAPEHVNRLLLDFIA